MNRKEFRKPAYIRPCMNLFPLQAESLLLETSGNAGTIKPGAGAGDAKEGWFNDEEEEEEEEETLGVYNY